MFKSEFNKTDDCLTLPILNLLPKKHRVVKNLYF